MPGTQSIQAPHDRGEGELKWACPLCSFLVAEKGEGLWEKG